MILYKYRDISNTKSFEYTLDSLKNKYLYFSRPSELNDPFDCQIQVDLSATEEEIIRWLEVYKSRLLPGNKLSTVDSFLKELKKGDAQAFVQKMAKIMIAESNHLLSLTTNYLNDSMWALYAGKYNGICIGYNICDDLSFDPVKIEATDIFNHYSIIFPPKKFIFEKIEYNNDGKHYVHLLKNRDEQIGNVVYNLTHKKDYWKTESEYRALLFDTELVKQPKTVFSTKVFYDDNLLEEILFGYQVPDVFIDSIRKMIEASYKKTIKYYKVSPDLYNYTLKKEQI
ncbi:MAG: DUF2971 domain-containing protein [Spirochaetia bacterium]|nr:DUF2971 domain-containing protein [Spirochaetia bacterium]